MAKFKAEYEVDDGYVGGSRPKYFRIDEGDIEDDMDEADLRSLFQEEMQRAFEQQVSPFQKNEDAFVEWAKEQQKAIKD